MFVLGKPLQPSLMFAGKAVAYPIEAPFSYSTLGQAPSLTRLGRLAMEKHSSLLQKVVTYGRKKI